MLKTRKKFFLENEKLISPDDVLKTVNDIEKIHATVLTLAKNRPSDIHNEAVEVLASSMKNIMLFQSAHQTALSESQKTEAKSSEEHEIESTSSSSLMRGS